MIRLQWNALRVGQHVLVHDETEAGMPLVPGRVATVQAASGSNVVAIRIPSTRGPSKVVHPPRLAVHLDELDPEAHCWRCEARADEALRQRHKAPTGGVTE
jgi:hypothetical protein